MGWPETEPRRGPITTRTLALSCLLALAFLLAACGGASTGTTPAAALARPTFLPLASATAVPPSATAVPATDTALPPTPTVAASPTSAAAAPPALLPLPPATPGAENQARCGDYAITQKMGRVNEMDKLVEITLKDPQGKEVKTIAANTAQGESLEQLQCGDLTGEGAPELIVESYTGGAHCCFTYDIYQLSPGLPALLHWEAGNGGINRFERLSGQPALEIVGSDDRLAYFDSLPFAASPFIPIVFAYRDGKYVEATQDYPDLLSDDQSKYIGELSGCGGEEFCEKSTALHVYADGVLLNEEEPTLTEIQSLVTPEVYAWLESVKADAQKLVTR